MNQIYSTGFFLAIILFPVGALFQPAFLGVWAASPASLILFALAMFRLFRFRFKDDAKEILLFIIWIAFMSLVSMSLYGISKFYFFKGIASLMLVITWMAPLLIIPLVSHRVLFLSVRTALIVSFLGFIILDNNIGPHGLIRNLLVSPEFHDINDSRPKGLSSESSHFSATLGRLLFAWFLIKEAGKQYSSSRLLLFLFVFGFIMLITGSKGAVISLAAMAMATFFSLRSMAIFFLTIPIGFMMFPDLTSLLEVDLQNFSSVTTRSGLALAAIMAFLANPFGYGVYGFYPVVADYGIKAIETLPAIMINLSEIETIVYQLESVSFKSTIFDFIVIGGLAFIRIIYVYFSRIDKSDPRALIAIFYLIASGFYVEGLQSIGFFLLLGVIFNYYKKTTA